MTKDTRGAITQAIDVLNLLLWDIEWRDNSPTEKAVTKALKNLKAFRDGVPESLPRKLKSLDNLEEHMNKHGSFGMSEPEPWAVCRTAAQQLQDGIK